VWEPLSRFQKSLVDIGVTIEQRNAERRRPYNFLRPSGVPQSINI
jgi:arachidonate 15-lipoxygenase